MFFFAGSAEEKMSMNYKYAGMAASFLLVVASAVSLPIYYPLWGLYAYLNFGLLVFVTLYLGIHIGMEWRSYQLKKMFSAVPKEEEEPIPELPDPCKVVSAPEHDPAQRYLSSPSPVRFTKPAFRGKNKKKKK